MPEPTPKMTRLKKVQGALAAELFGLADILAREDITHIQFSINFDREGNANTVVRFEVRHG